jgi:hypothetical protein
LNKDVVNTFLLISNQKVNLGGSMLNNIFRILSFIFLLYFFTGCQNSLLDPSKLNETPQSISSKKYQTELITLTYVEGTVYLGGTRIEGAQIYLFDKNLNLLANTTTNDTGYYELLICPYGYGERMIMASIFISNSYYTANEWFIFNEDTGRKNDWTFKIDLHLREERFVPLSFD